MSIERPDTHDLLTALALPTAALVQQPVPRKMLSESGAATPADRKLVQDGLEELTWWAALKPGNVGVATYGDELRSYLEVAVLTAKLRILVADAPRHDLRAAKVNASIRRLAELIHRAIPYPTVLLLEDSQQALISMAHIRWAQREADRTVLDEEPLVVPIVGAASHETSAAAMSALFDALALNKQPRVHMHALYQGWFDVLSAWQAVELTGHFKLSATAAQAAERRAAWRDCKDLDAQIAAARSAARKEKQVARQVAANLKIEALLAARQRVAPKL